MAYETEVARGTALLDEKVPGWRERISLDRFSITGCWECILGQLYGGYGEALRVLGFEDGGEACGFIWSEGADDYEELEAAWRRALAGDAP